MLATQSHALYTFQSATGNDRMKSRQSDSILTHTTEAEPSTDTEMEQEVSRHWGIAATLSRDWQCETPGVQSSKDI